MPHLIGVNGFKQSGKGTVAKIVSAIYNDGDAVVHEVGFADKLKILAAQTIGFDRPPRDLIALMDEAKLSWAFDIRQPEGPHRSFTGRQFLQQLGTRARENFGDDFWVDQVLPVPGKTATGDELRVADRYPGVDCVVFTDLRFPNEAERVRRLGGVVWEVLRPGLGSDGHASEQKLPAELVDYTINNATSIRALELRVEAALETLTC